MNFLFLVFALSSAFGCDIVGTNPKSSALMKKLNEIDVFLAELPKSQSPEKDINGYIQKNGLLLNVLMDEQKAKNFPESKLRDQMSTGVHSLFVKKLSPTKEYGFEKVHEIADPKATKVLRTWHIPANDSPSGISGQTLILENSLSNPCTQKSRSLTYEVKSNGTFVVIPSIKLLEPTFRDDCPAMKTLFKGSAYMSCVEFVDLKSKKKRILLYQTPMT